MEKAIKNTLKILSILFILFTVWDTYATVDIVKVDITFFPPDTIPDTTNGDTVIDLPFPMVEKSSFEIVQDEEVGLHLLDPDNMKTEIKYDPDNNLYEFQKKVGTLNLNTPQFMTFDEYLIYDLDLSIQNYWKER